MKKTERLSYGRRTKTEQLEQTNDMLTCAKLDGKDGKRWTGQDSTADSKQFEDLWCTMGSKVRVTKHEDAQLASQNTDSQQMTSSYN